MFELLCAIYNFEAVGAGRNIWGALSIWTRRYTPKLIRLPIERERYMVPSPRYVAIGATPPHHHHHAAPRATENGRVRCPRESPFLSISEFSTAPRPKIGPDGDMAPLDVSECTRGRASRFTGRLLFQTPPSRRNQPGLSRIIVDRIPLERLRLMRCC